MNTQNSLPKSVTTQLETFLTTQRLPTIFQLKLLAGDGSPRQFFRMEISSNRKTFLFLYDPAWILSQDYAAHQAFLKASNIPVPAFLHVDSSLGFLVMEDLGDDLLQFYLKRNSKEKMLWLEKSIDILADLHGKSFPVPQNLPCATRSFDEKKYAEELNFTWSHLANGFLKEGDLSQKTSEKMAEFCKTLEKIRPLVFCHRDYHIRNILIQDQKLFLIDFQDARLGPAQYDLASLLWDPYMEINAEEKKVLKEHYIKKIKTFPSLSSKINWETFETDLKKVAFQRLVKAAGSFASFFTRYGKETHLAYLKPALERAIEISEEIPELKFLPLTQWLDKIKVLKKV